MSHIDADIQAAEKELDDDAESIITNERYVYIAELIKSCYKKHNQGQLSASDKDRPDRHQPLAGPAYFRRGHVSGVLSSPWWTVGSAATDWANDGLFGDGWHLFGMGPLNTLRWPMITPPPPRPSVLTMSWTPNPMTFDPDAALADMKAVQPDAASATIEVEDEETLAQNEMTVYYDAIPADADEETTVA